MDISVGNVLRGVAKRVDPSPSEVLVSITPLGRERAQQLLGKSQLGIILNYLLEFSPRTIAEIAHDCEMDTRVVKRNIEAYPYLFEVRTR